MANIFQSPGYSTYYERLIFPRKIKVNKVNKVTGCVGCILTTKVRKKRK